MFGFIYQHHHMDHMGDGVSRDLDLDLDWSEFPVHCYVPCAAQVVVLELFVFQVFVGVAYSGSHD